jgi:hypothetical protein
LFAERYSWRVFSTSGVLGNPNREPSEAIYWAIRVSTIGNLLGQLKAGKVNAVAIDLPSTSRA